MSGARGALLVAAACAVVWQSIGGRLTAREPARVIVEREAYLMGTRVRLAVYASYRHEGTARLHDALAALEDTEAELSTWRDHSAMSMLNRTTAGIPWKADERLCRMFGELYEWHRETNGAFDPAVGALTAAWGIHDRGRVPSDAEVRAAAARSGLRRISFDRDACTLTRAEDVTVDVGAFGKGEALDRAAARLRGMTWLIDLGGQVAAGVAPEGGAGWNVDIAHPLVRERPFRHVRLSRGSLSTSAGSERDRSVDGRRVGHILDPRTGAPASFAGSVTVWHEQALAADILSTALYVMGPEEGMQWAGARGLSVCYLVPAPDGVKTLATPGFRRLIARE